MNSRTDQRSNKCSWPRIKQLTEFVGNNAGENGTAICCSGLAISRHPLVTTGPPSGAVLNAGIAMAKFFVRKK